MSKTVRWLRVLGIVFVVGVLVWNRPWADDLPALTHDFVRPFYSPAGGAVIDTLPSADSVTIMHYSTEYNPATGDTAGHGTKWTFSPSTDGFAQWATRNPPTLLVNIFWDSCGAVRQLEENYLITGRALGEGQVSDTSQFASDVIPKQAYRDSTIASSFLEDGVVTSAKIYAAAVKAEHVWKDAGDTFTLSGLSTDGISPLDSTAVRIDVGPYELPLVSGAAGYVLASNGAGVAAGWSIASAAAVLPVDYDRGLDVVSDSLGIKLNGPTLALSASGLKANIAYGVRLLPKAAGEEIFYCAGADIGDCVLVSWTPRDTATPYCTGTGYRWMTILGAVTAPDSIYVWGACGGAAWAGGDSCYSWMIIDP